MRALLAFVDADEDWQDIFFIVAAILCLIAAWLHMQAQALPAALVSLGLAAIAVGLLFVA